MARLTLSFRDKRLRVYPLVDDEIRVGRDPECAIHIDSLAVEPIHARIRHREGGYVLVPADGVTTLKVNHRPVEGEHRLQDGDLVQVGKHTLSFGDSAGADTEPAASSPSPPTGWMQIMSGPHLGRTIRLDRAMTRLGKADIQAAMVVRRNDGYHLSHLEGEGSPRVNDEPIGEHTRHLVQGDRVRIGDLDLHFFVDEPVVQSAPQRRFNRVPFEAEVTLSHGGQHWATELIDISLKGALIRRPAEWSGFRGNGYCLNLKLAKGTQITLDVDVAHVDDDRVGLSCRELGVESMTHLRRLLELNLGDPEALERDLSALG
ncbi:MAG TPA: PilZ domain-containing protein [Gammaproteobacteria bacterium]|nr:PilZ domain-containing protein [Gammaproteobacteria bacterium]